MARPPAGDDRRSRHLGVRLSAAEAVAIAAAAKETGTATSVWVRDTALAAASTWPQLATPARRERAAAVQKLAIAVRRVGGNINQIARRVHERPATAASVIASTQAGAQFAETRAVLEQVLDLLDELRPSLRRELR